MNSGSCYKSLNQMPSSWRTNQYKWTPTVLCCTLTPHRLSTFWTMKLAVNVTLSTMSEWPALLSGIIIQWFNSSTGCRVYSFAWQPHFSRCRVSSKILDGNILTNGKSKSTCMTDLYLNRHKQTALHFKIKTVHDCKNNSSPETRGT